MTQTNSPEVQKLIKSAQEVCEWMIQRHDFFADTATWEKYQQLKSAIEAVKKEGE